MGAVPLKIVHDIIKLSTPDDGRVIFCPQVKTAIDGSITGGDDGGTRCGSPIKRKNRQVLQVHYYTTSY